MEFALAWPIVLLLVLGAVQLALWASESAAARGAALAGARAGTVAGAGTDMAARVTLNSLTPALVGAGAAIWCPADSGRQPMLWISAGEEAERTSACRAGAMRTGSRPSCSGRRSSGPG